MCIKIAGREIQEWARPFMRPELVAPYADIVFIDDDKIPAEGPALVVFNHRSYFDPTVMGLLLAKAGRNMRGLGKKEVFDVPRRRPPAAGPRRRPGRAGIGFRRAAEGCGTRARRRRARDDRARGHHPSGSGVLRPRAQGPVGAAKLAAETGVPVIPVGLWGTEKVWPRSPRLPNINPLTPPGRDRVVGDPSS